MNCFLLHIYPFVQLTFMTPIIYIVYSTQGRRHCVGVIVALFNTTVLRRPGHQQYG